MLGLSPICTDAFAVQPTLVGRTIRLQVSGTADGEIQPLLPGYLQLVHAEAERLGVSEVIVDVHELYFMNSSCFKAFVTWMDALGRAGAERRYSLRFLKDRNLHWQTRSLDALRRMAIQAVMVEDYPGSHP